MTYTAEYNAQLAALVASISAVDNVGRVHDRPRHGDFRSMWVTEIDGVTQIRSWEISIPEERVERIQQNHRHRYRTWQINGVLGLSDMAPDAGDDDLDPAAGDVYGDASFHVIHRLAGEISDQIEADRAAGVAANTWIDFEPVQKTAPVVVEIGGGAVAWGVTLTVVGYTIVSP